MKLLTTAILAIDASNDSAHDFSALLGDASEALGVSSVDLSDTLACCLDVAVDALATDDSVIELLQALADGDNDITTDSIRAIHRGEIDDILVSELSADTYSLGCFNPEFLARATDLPVAVFEALRKAECFEETGELVLSIDGALETLAANYALHDGYGYQFAQYDFEEHTLGDYYFFRLS